MFKPALIGIMLLAVSFTISAAEGLIQLESSYSVKETADRFEELVSDKPITIFARIDHQKGAMVSELELRPTEVIIFGNPAVGTPLMQCAQSVGIDLPQKILISEDKNGQVWLSYNDPSYLKSRHNIQGCDEQIDKVSGLLAGLSKEALAK